MLTNWKGSEESYRDDARSGKLARQRETEEAQSKRKSRGDLTMFYSYLHGEGLPGSTGLLHLTDKGRGRASGWKLKRDTFRLELSCSF